MDPSGGGGMVAVELEVGREALLDYAPNPVHGRIGDLRDALGRAQRRHVMDCAKELALGANPLQCLFRRRVVLLPAVIKEWLSVPGTAVWGTVS